MSEHSDSVQRLLDRCQVCLFDARAPVGRRLLSLHTSEAAGKGLLRQLDNQEGLVLLARAELDASKVSELDQVLAVARVGLVNSQHTIQQIERLDTVTIHELGEHLKSRIPEEVINRGAMEVPNLEDEREIAIEIYIAMLGHRYVDVGDPFNEEGFKELAKIACAGAVVGLRTIKSIFPNH
jgi:hypothetical protein